MKNLIQNLINSIFSNLIVLISLSLTSILAKAGEVRTVAKNGIALNANPVYGYKHGGMKVSQYFTSTYNDDEQKWEVIPTNNGLSVLRNIAHNKCFNSHQTSVGSIPNLYGCDINDPDKQVIINGNSIIHGVTGLELNLGDQNDTVVSWKQTNTVRSSYSSREYAREGNSYTGPKVGNASGYNDLKGYSMKGAILTCTRYIDSVKWIYRDMYTDPSIGKKVFKWSLNIIPSECGRTTRNPTLWKSWEEVVSKTPFNNEGSSVVWDKKWNTSQYWSMYNQYVCHTDFATWFKKYDYNLEPDRINVGYFGITNKDVKCNGKFN
jgi:Protein of unknown function (DUF2599)